MRKLIIDLDPGIGDAVAAVLAMLDPELDLLALTATSGIVPGPVATRNLYSIVAHVDPPKWPRIGSASITRNWHKPDEQTSLGTVNGPTGLGDLEIFAPSPHHKHESAKVLIDIVREYPHQVTLLTLGPLTNIVAACELAPDFLSQLGELVCLGGAVSVGGDISAAAEANMYLDPEAARQVLSAPEVKTLVPLDATNSVIITYDHFNRVSTAGRTPATLFLKQLLPYYFRAHHQYLGMEGIWLREVVALAAVARPPLCKPQPMRVDVEVAGTLTCGMTVVERRSHVSARANTSVVLDVDAQGVVDYMTQLLQ
ncbi:MAG: nucleoside hydrolase [Planctomycetes bacterium]|nr:nucleoside hydrolase [Planctomycetota bacterium]